MEDEHINAARGALIGLAVTCAGAGMLWGIGGTILAFGLFMMTMAMVKYWKTE